MVAEAPDHHRGGPGCVGDGKNDLNGAHILGHGEAGYIIFIHAMPATVRRGSVMPI